MSPRRAAWSGHRHRTRRHGDGRVLVQPGTTDPVTARAQQFGYQIDAIPGCFRSELKPATVRKLAQLGASVTVSIYPAELAEG